MTPAANAVVTHLQTVGCCTPQQDTFVRWFEVPRVMAMFDAIETFGRGTRLEVLNVGYLNGLVPVILDRLDVAGRLAVTSTERDIETSERAQTSASALLPGHVVVPLDLAAPNSAPMSKFDVVLLGEVVEHLPSPTLASVFELLADLLYDGGIVVVTTPNLHALSFRIRHALGADVLHDPISHETMGLPHVTLLGSRLLSDLGRSAGLIPVSVCFNDFTSAPRARRSKRVALARRIRSATLS